MPWKPALPHDPPKHPQDATEKQGDLVSWHSSRDAAALAAGLSSSLQVLSLNHVEIYQDAWRGFMALGRNLGRRHRGENVHNPCGMLDLRGPLVGNGVYGSADNDNEPVR
jgi:hypothetical protein